MSLLAFLGIGIASTCNLPIKSGRQSSAHVNICSDRRILEKSIMEMAVIENKLQLKLGKTRIN